MMLRIVLAISTSVLLAACGGGAGPVLSDVELPIRDVEAPASGVAGDNPQQVAAEKFGTTEPEDTETEGSVLAETLSESDKVEIALAGVKFVRGETVGGSTVEIETGQFTVANGTRTLHGDQIVLSDDIPGLFLESSAFLNDTEGAVGVIGIPTETSNMPTVGGASFSGGAVGLVIVGDAGFDLTNGVSDVIVDFKAGTVQVDLGGFESVSLVSGNLDAAPFTAITLSGAEIDGTTFSGGTLQTTGGARVEDVVGRDARILSQGQFFGAKESVAGPAEVGGIIFAEGAEGLIYSSFIAD